MLKRFFSNEYNVLALIVVNAIIITLLYFPALENNVVLELLDRVITVLFVMEAIAKMKVLGLKGYFSFAWNRFDFLLVMLSLPSLLIGLVSVPDTSFWLLLRLFRLARLLRLFRFVPHIERLVAGLGRALKASFLVMAVLAFFNFLLAIITCHFFRNICPDLFGDPFRSMYSMFQIFTIEGWNEIPAQIQQNVQDESLATNFLSGASIVVISRIYFATTMLFGGIFGLSLANAVFVDEMTIDNTDHLERKVDRLSKQLDELKRLMLAQSGEPSAADDRDLETA